MEEILIDGERYAIPPGKTAADIYRLVKGRTKTTAAMPTAPATPSENTYTYPQKESGGSLLGDLDQDVLTTDRDWLYASGRLHKMNEGKEFVGTAKDLADYGLDKLGYFNYNIGSMALDTRALSQADKEDQKAFLYLMEKYDELAPSWRGAGRMAKGVATDPTTYLGLASLGIGFGGSQAAKAVGKSAVKLGLKEALKAGIATGAYSAADDIMRQDVERNVRTDQEYSGARTLGAAAIGGTIGAVLGGGVAGTATALSNRKAARLAEGVVDDALPPSTAPTPTGTPTPDAPPIRTPNEITPAPVEIVDPAAPPVRPVDDTLPPVNPADETLPPADTVPPGATPDAVPNPANPAPVVVNADEVLDEVITGLNTKRKNPGKEFMELIRATTDDEGWRLDPLTGRADVSARTQEAIDMLTTINRVGAKSIERFARKANLTSNQHTELKASLQAANRHLFDKISTFREVVRSIKDPNLRKNAKATLERLENAQSIVNRMDMEASSASGADLAMRSRANAITGDLRQVSSIDEVMKNNPTFTRTEAQLYQEEAYKTWLKNTQQSEIIRKITDDIEVARERGDFSSAIRLIEERRLAEKTARDEARKDMSPEAWKKFNSAANEVYGGLIFSPGTLGINLFTGIPKLLTKPLLNTLVDGNASVRGMLVSYDVMRKSVGIGLKYSKSVWDYEKNPFYAKQADFFGGDATIPGIAGRAVRFYQTSMDTIDGAMAQVAYRGHVAAEDYNLGVRVARENGITKKADIHEFAKNYMEKGQLEAFEDTSGTTTAFETAMRNGQRKGYSGAKLENYIKNSLATDKTFFSHPTRKESRSYTEELVFRNSFKGDTWLSKQAMDIEKNFAGNIFFRVGLQAFFRAPIRIFEEGLRLTPGLNFITPGFLADLRGKTTPTRQIRAQGEALLSLSLGAGVMAMYATGSITGSGQGNGKQLKNKQNAGDWEPYTIYFPNGTKLSYRNLDPIGTPLKILVNSLEAYENHSLRKKQGEFTDVYGDEAAVKELLSWVGMAFMPAVRAVKDSNVTEGINQLYQFGEWMINPEGSTSTATSFLTEKARILIPNTYTRIDQAFGDATPMREQSGVLNGLLNKINPHRGDTPVQRDILGNPMYIDYGRSIISGVAFNNDIYAKDISEEGKEVALALSDLENTSGATFDRPFKFPQLGNVDTRKVYMADGKTTWYDAIYDNFSALKPEQALAPILTGYGADVLANGRPSNNTGPGTKVTQVRSILDKYRKQAINQFMSSNPEAMDRYMQVQQNKATTSMGGFDLD